MQMSFFTFFSIKFLFFLLLQTLRNRDSISIVACNTFLFSSWFNYLSIRNYSSLCNNKDWIIFKIRNKERIDLTERAQNVWQNEIKSNSNNQHGINMSCFALVKQSTRQRLIKRTFLKFKPFRQSSFNLRKQTKYSNKS